jgi:hypothetical protein
MRARAIFIQPRHGEPTMARNLFRVVHGDQTVGAAWISDHQHAHIGDSVFIAAKAGFENFANIAHGARIYTINDDYSGEHLMGPTIPAELLSLSPGDVFMQEHAERRRRRYRAAWSDAGRGISAGRPEFDQ